MSFRKVNFLLILLVPLIIYGFFTTFYKKVGDLRPALSPAVDVVKVIENQNGDPSLNSPFNLPPGFKITIFAKNLGNVRDLEISPQGMLVASITGAGKVVALPDNDNNGQADEVREILGNLNRPHGLAFHSGKLYIAEEARVVRYIWDSEGKSATPDKFLFSLPTGGQHFTRSIIFDKTGNMFLSIGSTCNVCFENHQWLAAVIISDLDGNNPKLFSKGLRNSVFMALNPDTNEVWATEMGRDFLGDNLPPDEINILGNGDYGWPVCFGDRVHDGQFDNQGEYQDRCKTTNPPLYQICPHCAPLGLTFIKSNQFPASWQGDLLVSLHGSWNSSTPVGYKIIRLDVEGNQVKGESDFMTGFLSDNQALGRPVDLVFDNDGNLYISDDKAGVVYRVSK